MTQVLKRAMREATAKKVNLTANPEIAGYMRHSGCTFEQAQRRVGKAEQSGKSIVVDGVIYKFI